MEIFKFCVCLLVILFRIGDVMPLLGYSKVSKDFLNNIQPSEYLVPEIYHPLTQLQINSTKRNHNRHMDHLKVILPLRDGEIILELQMNHKVMAKTFKQMFHKNGHEINIYPRLEEVDYCHYTGKIKNKKDSWVALSTCDGICGLIYDEQRSYFVEKSPQNDSNIHQVYISPLSLKQTHYSANRTKRNTVHNILGGPYNENENSRYIELGLVFDHDVYTRMGSLTKVTSYATGIVNLMNAYYSRINIFVVLVGVVVWTEHNEFVLETGTILNKFTNYAKSKLVKKFYFDSVHLISSINVIEDGIGVAGIGTVCDFVCTGVNDYLNNNILGTAVTLAHELGHNLGLVHDTSDCTCPDKECIMIGIRSYNTISHFSSCSIETMQKAYVEGKHYCLKNKPKVVSNVSPSCGNGILEPGEECDCGLLQYCENHCCDSLTCTFTNNSECATGPCCDVNSCKLKDAATPCRPATNECDLPEYCTGESHNCPDDTFKFDTEKCNEGQSYCHQGFCGIDSKCSAQRTSLNNKYLECYKIDSHLVNENNYCKTNIFTDALFSCNSWSSYFRTCSQAKHETIFFDSKAVGIHTSIYGQPDSIMVCTLTMIDDDPVAVQNASLCNTNPVRCLTMSNLRKQIPGSPMDCHNRGWCNNKGHCHCKDGYSPPDCSEPGFGGSLESGPSSNSYGFILVRNIMFIVFLGIIPLMALIAITSYLIMEKHGSCGIFLKTLFAPKEVVPTISLHMSQEQNFDQSQNRYFGQNGNTSDISPILFAGNEGVSLKNDTIRYEYSEPLHYSKPTFSTFLKRMSLNIRGLPISNVDKPRKKTSENEVEYMNTVVTKSETTKRDYYAMFKKTQQSKNEVEYANALEINHGNIDSKVYGNMDFKQSQQDPGTSRNNAVSELVHAFQKQEPNKTVLYQMFNKNKGRKQKISGVNNIEINESLDSKVYKSLDLKQPQQIIKTVRNNTMSPMENSNNASQKQVPDLTAVYSMVNKSLDQKQKQQKVSRTDVNTNNRVNNNTQNLKVVSKQNNARGTVAPVYYEEFAKRKKKLQTASTTLKQQEQSGKVNSINSSHSQSHSSDSTLEDSKPTVREMIKRFNVNNV